MNVGQTLTSFHINSASLSALAHCVAAISLFELCECCCFTSILCWHVLSFPRVLIMGWTTCLYHLGTSGCWRDLKLNSFYHLLSLCTVFSFQVSTFSRLNLREIFGKVQGAVSITHNALGNKMYHVSFATHCSSFRRVSQKVRETNMARQKTAVEHPDTKMDQNASEDSGKLLLSCMWGILPPTNCG